MSPAHYPPPARIHNTTLTQRHQTRGTMENTHERLVTRELDTAA